MRSASLWGLLVSAFLILPQNSALAFHTWERTVLENGLTLSVVEKKDAPAVVITLALPVGSTSDPPRKSGLAAMTASLLRAGTTRRSARELEQRIADLGSRFDERTTFDFTLLQVAVLKEDLAPALDLLADVVVHPAFPESEIGHVRADTVDQLRSFRETPEEVVLRTFFEGSPYGDSIPGTPTSVTRITRADLVAFHSTFYRPRSACLAVAGDVSMDAVRRAAARSFGAWSGSAPDRRDVQLGVVTPASRTVILDRRLAQANALFAFAFHPPTRADLAAMKVLAQALGGGPESRLGRNLREEKGWVYGVRAAVEPYHSVALLSVALSVPYASLDPAIDEAWKELGSIETSRLTERELTVAKERAKLDFYSATESLVGLSRVLAEHEVAGGVGKPDEVIEEIDRVSADDVERIARSLLVRDDAMVAVEGDLGAIRGSVPSLADAAASPARPMQRPVPENEWHDAIRKSGGRS